MELGGRKKPPPIIIFNMEESMYDRFRRIMETEEFKKSCDEYLENLKRKEDIYVSQLERFHSKFSDPDKFSEFVDKVVEKYESNEYRYKWVGDAPSGLYWFLYNYAQKYGRECDEKEWYEYSHMFTDDIYFIHGYYFMCITGQGSFIEVFKNTTKNSP